VKSDAESIPGIISMLTQKVHQVMLISTQNGRAPFLLSIVICSSDAFDAGQSWVRVEKLCETLLDVDNYYSLLQFLMLRGRSEWRFY
jgi:hypothetical protein